MILITGGTGALGKKLLVKLLDLQVRIKLLVLPGERIEKYVQNKNVTVVTGDISVASSINGICKDVSVVLHMAAVIKSEKNTHYQVVNVHGTSNILTEAVNANVKKFVYISSASVIYPIATAYSQSKKDAEILVRYSGLNWTIIRPTLIYDDYGGMELEMFLQSLVKYSFIPVVGNGLAIKRPIHADCIVDGLLKVLMSDKGYRSIYNFSGIDSISIINLIEMCKAGLNVSHKPVIHIPVWCCWLIVVISKIIFKKPILTWNAVAGVIQDADLDPSKAIKDFGYNPQSLYTRFPLMLENMYQLFQSKKKVKKVNALIYQS